MSATFDIIIIGGGMAGLSLASALRDTPARVALVEANPWTTTAPPSDDGVTGYDPRVSALTPATVDFLRQLDAWPAIESARHCAFERMHVWDAMGTAQIDFSAAEVGKPTLGYIVENSITLQALKSSLQEGERFSLFTPRKLVALRNSCAPGAVQEIDLDDGTRLAAQLLVAADGGNSQLRQLAEFDSRQWSYQQKAIVCTVATEHSHQDTAWQRFLPQGPLAFLPLSSEGQPMCSIVWSADTDYADELLSLGDEAFKHALDRAFESRLGRIQAVSQRFSFPLRQNHATDYVKPGIALIGDAAHVIHPLAGQGVNLGFKDVQVLAAEVRRAWQGGAGLGSELFLQRYQRRRKSDNLAMMAAVEGFKRLFGSRQLPLVWLRNAGMRQVSRIAPLKQQIVRHAMGL